MADKKRSRKRKDEYVPPGEEVKDKPTKEEYSVASWMRKNVPIKRTKFLNHKVEYFSGRKAIDALMESKFTQGDNALFTSRENVVAFLQVMLQHKLYHRAKKVPVSEQELRGKKKDKKKDVESGDEQKSEKEENKGTDAESSVVEGKDSEKPREKRKKKKIRLEMHNDQRFIDSTDAYVWIYDPIPFHYWIIGALLVVGAIGVCLFPLWPPVVRLGVYYLSVAAVCFLVSVIVMAVIRLILFCLIWMVTLGRHHLWILPNLTEDVGFFASFWPLYKYDYRGPGAAPVDKKKKKKKDKDSDAEEEVDEPTTLKEEKKESSDEDKGHPEDIDGHQNVSESENESKSSTERDFEIVDKHDLDDQ